MDENKEKKNKKDKKIFALFKVTIFSKNVKTKKQFLKAIKAKYLFKTELEDKFHTGATFSALTYKKNESYVFQFWSISNKSRFEIMIPNFILGSHGIIYFYHVDEKIEENRLKLIKNAISPKNLIFFIGYDSILPPKPEQSDNNIRLIKKYFDNFNSLYVSVDKPDSMFQILDRIIDLQAPKGH